MGNYIQGQVGAIEGSMLGVTGTLTNDSAAVGVLHATMPDGSTVEIRAKSEFTEVGLTEGFEARSIAKDGTQFTTYIGHADAGSTSNAEIPQEEGVDIRGDDPIEECRSKCRSYGSFEFYGFNSSYIRRRTRCINLG